MKARDVLLYQFGSRSAIEQAARNRWLPLIGAMLVLITSVPRNYDQTYLGEVPWWPVLPLVFSFFSGALVFAFLDRGIFRKALAKEESGSSYFWQFLGLFWLTAPVAWLYAAPVERFLDPRSAMVANLYLLGVVSLWRVALLTRVVSVLFGMAWFRAGAWVLLAASVETVLVLFFRGFGEGIARGMGGMRNSPEEDLLVRVLGLVFWLALGAIAFLSICILADKRAEEPSAPPKAEGGRVPWIFLGVAAVVWTVIAIEPQMKLRHEFRYAEMLKNREYRAALDYLNGLEEKDWPAAKPFRPNAHELEVWRWLPGLMEKSTENEKPWVQRRLLETYAATFKHRRGFSSQEHLTILKAIERFPEGRGWIAVHRKELAHVSKKLHRADKEDEEAKLADFLATHGVKLEEKPK
jgi:hypothetical protein